VPVPSRDLLDCLERKLEGRPAEGSHRFLLFYDDTGRLLTKAMISHGRRELSDRELGLVARNLGVPASALRDCAACTLGRSELLPLLLAKADGRPA
jgi:hypothetical protein